MKLLLAALLVLALAAPLARVRPAGAITCDGGSDDGRMYTPEHVNYYYQADTTCPVAIYMVSVASWIEAKQLLPPYLDWERTHDFPDKFTHGSRRAGRTCQTSSGCSPSTSSSPRTAAAC